ncbi:hypothetical protein EG328_011428 [Venturia inaequalis]|uniref:J domain-containing protein n=1 Tax=Venturia inaequalis TaxID=5025 RepID=A0A8H3Z126_VENIN|nr:hypothetical protein EG328_011428 [Venturia inaequalis]
MASRTVREDYYRVLEVDPSTNIEQITSSYRRLALKLHPDRNPQDNAKEAFQLLGQAYETLKDEDKRREYDLTYPSIRTPRQSSARHTSASRQQPRPTPRSPSPISFPRSYTLEELEAIVVLQRAKNEREKQWRLKRRLFDDRNLELKSEIQNLEDGINYYKNGLAAEEAVEKAKRNDWFIGRLIHLYTKRTESEEEKESRSREKRERKLENDTRERALLSSNLALSSKTRRLEKAKQEFDDANLVDDYKIWKIEATARVRLGKERQQWDRC